MPQETAPTELQPRKEEYATAALLAQAELEHFRSGAMRLTLLFGAAVCALAIGALPFWPLPSWLTPISIATGIAAFAALLWAAQMHRQLYWHLGRRPWLLVPIAVSVSVVLAAEGMGSSVLYFPAVTLIALPVCVGRPRWNWTMAGVLLATPNMLGVSMHLAGVHTGYGPTGSGAVLQDLALILLAAVFWQLIERQARYVPIAFICMILSPPPRTVNATHDQLDLIGVPRNEEPFTDGEDIDDLLLTSRALPPPERDVDIAEITRTELGLTSRELEVLLLLLGGTEESEIGLRLAYLSKGRDQISRSTVNKHIEAAKRKIASTHGLASVTTAQAAGLLQATLDKQGEPQRTGLPASNDSKATQTASAQ